MIKSVTLLYAGEDYIVKSVTLLYAGEEISKYAAVAGEDYINTITLLLAGEEI